MSEAPEIVTRATQAELLHPDVVYEIPQPRERIRGRDRYLRRRRAASAIVSVSLLKDVEFGGCP